ncbi:pyrroloquinoline quinone biosynthesis protein PqqB [Bradyrhizobium sp. CSA207]|uniref:pyrroloquinoline quinone biosynthesis protein PqqB n=1 Tax=Bradyrhizobium sp. CSA207 TaxID=2698826 RepID=UPI0023AECE90|nr:pyrroloquinoline quinone biosynthesis protein PqqB [Bradyrhizobium sp. CSA207]MDE5442672.1 pyrroloquinoline quinone biosynthesis protein PqqB [Bradyrhizobium sp. CSA207]
MLRVVVLGAAAGGGVPQWNCGCEGCRAARANGHELQRTQASVAFSGDGEHWFLINASPDLRQQLNAAPQLHPKAGVLRHTPIAGVILTNGEVDAVAGLLSMRESSPFAIYAHPKVLAILKSNNIFDVLNEKYVRRCPIALDVAFEPVLSDGSPSGLEVLPFIVPGKGAWYLEGKAHPGGSDGAGDTVGLRITDKATEKYFYFLAACAEVTDALKAMITGAPLVFFDGTVWQDDEMIRAGLGQKTGKSMGHISMSGDHGAIASLSNLAIDRKIFLHINNSNPALLPASPERKAAERAGWQIPSDGTEIVL